MIVECEQTLDRNNPRHFIDMYLIDRDEQKDNPELKHKTRNSKLDCCMLLY